MDTPMTPPTPPTPPVDQTPPPATLEPPTPTPPAAVTATGPSDSYHDLNMWARRNASAGAWEFGVTLDTVDVVLFSRKLGGLDDDLREAFQPGFRAQRAEAYLRERLGF